MYTKETATRQCEWGSVLGPSFCATMFPTIVNNLTWTILLHYNLYYPHLFSL